MSKGEENPSLMASPQTPTLASRPTGHQSFVPKPFPPPALRDVPEVYIISQLHRLAPSYWNRPETADCTISETCALIAHAQLLTALHRQVVPCDITRPSTAQPPHPDPLTTGPFGSQNRASSRRESEPATNTRRMVLKLHQDYLSAQSTFMRALFSGSSPLDLSTSAASSSPPAPPDDPPESVALAGSQSPPYEPTSHLAAGAFPLHTSRHPRVLPSSSLHHPVVFLPVPDPTSFPHLIHYLYFGTFDYMEECLHRGIITWQGVVRNVEYLGMRLELKASLGRYYRQWLRPNTPQDDPRASELPVEDSEDEGDTSDGSLGSVASRSLSHSSRHFPILPPGG